MTAEALKAWIKARRLSHQEAATLLAMSVSGLRHNLYGQKPISKQTALIVKLREREWHAVSRVGRVPSPHSTLSPKTKRAP